MKRPKVQPAKDQETIKLTQPAEDVEEKLSTDNTKVAVLVDIPEQKLEDVKNNFKSFR
jgi:hypothetical protein